MKKRAFKSLEAFLFITLLSFVDEGMKLLLLPAVTVRAFFKALAALFIAGDESATLPVLAKLRFIAEEVGFTAKILEIMCVHTLRFIMFMVVGTPFCLEKKYVEVEIRIQGQQIVDQAHL